MSARGRGVVTGTCPPVVFEGGRRALLVLHAIGSMVLAGAATHHAIEVRHYVAGRFGRHAIEKLYAKVVAVSYVVTFALGAAVYPSYRVLVRALVLERTEPALTAWFDVKETFAAVALLPAIGLGVMAFTARPADAPWTARAVAGLSFVVCAVVWLNVVVGLLTAATHGAG
jgi:hypothetical protein